MNPPAVPTASFNPHPPGRAPRRRFCFQEYQSRNFVPSIRAFAHQPRQPAPLPREPGSLCHLTGEVSSPRSASSSRRPSARTGTSWSSSRVIAASRQRSQPLGRDRGAVTKAADGSDEMRALSENIVRAALNPVDQWRGDGVAAGRGTGPRPPSPTALASPVRTRGRSFTCSVDPSRIRWIRWRQATCPCVGNSCARSPRRHSRSSVGLEEAQTAQGQRRRRHVTGPCAFQATDDGQGSLLFGDDLAKAYGIVGRNTFSRLLTRMPLHD